MNKNDLIETVAEQAVKLSKIKKILARRESQLQAINDTLVCIGGPLNDSRIKYTAKQLKIFHDIHEESRP